MKKWACYISVFILLSGFSVAHKFYVSIYQLHFAPEKKMLQITTRIFIDDLNNTLEKHFKVKAHLCDKAETPQDVERMKTYLAEKFIVKIAGRQKEITYLSKEVEGNVLICYFRITGVTKPDKIDIYNPALMELNDTQQNIIQYSGSGEKQSLLLTIDSPSGTLKP
ncbi:MAG: hypothetical protein CFE23_09505 [Flavobacterium sp. BFFFF1]|uniref:DUF6702 family protein n=1 Tax=Flavobacterium sp. BFFFF1 TaxID=2015557 RepID=UPI000BC3A51B|nr:DUF6702 family protein [Flavobacterium sp. BFFFF1]OYU80475.1 MAG: hypothetical protein CFE23_09505 [Flavobacterium sp. BFFFF1]